MFVLSWFWSTAGFSIRIFIITIILLNYAYFKSLLVTAEKETYIKSIEHYNMARGHRAIMSDEPAKPNPEVFTNIPNLQSHPPAFQSNNPMPPPRIIPNNEEVLCRKVNSLADMQLAASLAQNPLPSLPHDLFSPDSMFPESPESSFMSSAPYTSDPVLTSPAGSGILLQGEPEDFPSDGVFSSSNTMNFFHASGSTADFTINSTIDDNNDMPSSSYNQQQQMSPPLMDASPAYSVPLSVGMCGSGVGSVGNPPSNASFNNGLDYPQARSVDGRPLTSFNSAPNLSMDNNTTTFHQRNRQQQQHSPPQNSQFINNEHCMVSPKYEIPSPEYPANMGHQEMSPQYSPPMSNEQPRQQHQKLHPQQQLQSQPQQQPQQPPQQHYFEPNGLKQQYNQTICAPSSTSMIYQQDQTNNPLRQQQQIYQQQQQIERGGGDDYINMIIKTESINSIEFDDNMPQFNNGQSTAVNNSCLQQQQQFTNNFNRDTTNNNVSFMNDDMPIDVDLLDWPQLSDCNATFNPDIPPPEIISFEQINIQQQQQQQQQHNNNNKTIFNQCLTTFETLLRRFTNNNNNKVFTRGNLVVARSQRRLHKKCSLDNRTIGTVCSSSSNNNNSRIIWMAMYRCRIEVVVEFIHFPTPCSYNKNVYFLWCILLLSLCIKSTVINLTVIKIKHFPWKIIKNGCFGRGN